jgi:hypothetical protein
MTNDGIAIHDVYELQDTGQCGTGKLLDGTSAHPGFRHVCVALRYKRAISPTLAHIAASIESARAWLHIDAAITRTVSMARLMIDFADANVLSDAMTAIAPCGNDRDFTAQTPCRHRAAA